MAGATRKRAPEEFEQTGSQAGPQILTLGSLVGGYNGYTSPDLLSPQFWAACSNVYAGQFGTIRRARWAPILNFTTPGYTQAGVRMRSIFGWAPLPSAFSFTPCLIMDAGNLRQVFLQNPIGFGSNTAIPISPAFYYPPANLAGPVMRTSGPAFILTANGLLRSKEFTPYPLTRQFFEFLWGIDTPDVSPSVTLNTGSSSTIAAAPTGAVRANNIVTITTTGAHGLFAGQFAQISGVTDPTFNSATGAAFLILSAPSGTTFTYAQIGPPATSGAGTVVYGITKQIGRSYQWAWVNTLTGHESAPSPASQYVKYTSQIGTIDLVQVGTLTCALGNTIVTGTGSLFSPAWVGRSVWVEGFGLLNTLGNGIASVASASTMTLNTGAAFTAVGARFQVFDPQCDLNFFNGAIKLYATGDGQPVYFLIGQNVFNSSATTIAAAGLRFQDTANSEPPNAPFASEISQLYNVPPPIGSFLQEYQSRILVFGVAAAPTTFFYSNIEATIIGQPTESFSPLNTITLPIGDAKLNGMANLPTGMIIWSNHQDMFKLTGLLSDNTIASSTQLGATIQRLPYRIGAASAYANAVTPLGAIWLSSDREVWLFTDHYAPKNIGKPVQDILNSISGSRLAFAKASFYKSGDRSWFALAVSNNGAYNNKLLLLDLDLLASNGQPSYFTFDMATNAPTWYIYDIPCEALTTSYDSNSINHLLVGDVDLVTDVDWQPTYYTVSAEQNVVGTITLHAFGNEDPEMVKTFDWLRTMTNQQPSNLAAQLWSWNVYSYDDDVYVIGVNSLDSGSLIPGLTNAANSLFLEYSPALFKFGSKPFVKGRRFQIKTIFPATPGFFELRGFQVKYTSVVSR